MPYELVRLLNSDHPYRYDGTLFGGTKLWTPSQIATALWLDADSPSSITLNGSTVSQWNDKSGNGRHATQATAANQPTYTATGINNKPSLVFNDDWVTASLTRDTFSVFCVGSNSNLSLGIYYPLGFGDMRGLFAGGALVTQNFGLYNGSNLLQSTETATLNVPWMLYGKSTATGREIAVNGGNVVQDDKTQSITTVQVGKRGEAWQFIGSISEVIIADASLSTSDRQKMEGYLAWKWGLEANLPAGHPYKNLPPTV